MSSHHLVLGLDIGPNSLGWALLDEEGKRIVSAGVRVFEAGLDSLEKDGKGESRNLERRSARLIRRQLERRSRRLAKTAHVLQAAGLLPPGDTSTAEARHRFFEALDAQMDSPYGLRARALDEKLEPYELGRALYHLAQRRGFLSNRRESSRAKDDEDEGIVKEGISRLQAEIESGCFRSLGEYFATLKRQEQRIRSRYTSRKMYQDEFALIWQAQKKHYPAVLTDELRESVHHAIFHQRPLKSAKHLVGKCELEKGRRRAPWALLDAQRFRYLQRVNDLELTQPDERPLTPDERQKLLDYLELHGDTTFGKARKHLGFKNSGKGAVKFNLEAGGEKNLPGNRTASKLAKVFGEKRWAGMSAEERNAVVEDMLSIVKPEALKRRAMRHWGLDEAAADELCAVKLEGDYCNFSRKALRKLLPLLEQGLRLNKAIKQLYPDRWAYEGKPVDELPPLRKCEDPYLSEMRNPIVMRSLTEVRRVVNAIVAKHGKPAEIHIEMARQLRQSSRQRAETTKRIRFNEKKRKDACEKIAQEAGITEPTQTDILKVLLADECGWICPYTGKNISVIDLVGPHPQFDIEHIIPYERCLDDSFANKTLCEAEENREVKRNRTPYEAYHGTDRWDQIIHRVKGFKSHSAKGKLFRFTADEKEVGEFIDRFTNRQMNDTRYSSKVAKKYLGLLYGGVDDDGIDANRKRCVQATSGGVTAVLRRAWGLNSILGGGEKTRDDHRHHAVDAIAIALTDPAKVKALNNAAVDTMERMRRARSVKLPEPWDGLLEEARTKIRGITVSHRVDRRVRGPLHQETFYSPPKLDENGKKLVRVRKPLNAIGARDVASIVDPAVRAAVENRLRQLGETDPKKAFKDAANLPRHKNGHRIKSVRLVRPGEAVLPVGQGHRTRWVMPDRNHHMEIVEVVVKDKKGNIKRDKDGNPEVKWEGHVVSMLEAYQRLGRKEPVVKRDWGEGKKFLFSLAGGDAIQLEKEEGNPELFVVRTVPQSLQIHFVPINDARTLLEIGKVGLTGYPETLRKWKCRKVAVNPLGEVHYQND